MLVDTRREQNAAGFAVNAQKQANASFGQQLGWIIMVIFTFGILWIYSILWKNKFIQNQMDINNLSSNIQVNKAKRKDTLIKLLEQTKGYLKREKETLVLVSKYRSGLINPTENARLDGQLSQFMINLKLQYEQYPQLKADKLVSELMNSSKNIETEIATCRKMYNQFVTLFNTEIFKFPKIVLATKMKLEAFALYQASENLRVDVDMSSLNRNMNIDLISGYIT